MESLGGEGNFPYRGGEEIYRSKLLEIRLKTKRCFRKSFRTRGYQLKEFCLTRPFEGGDLAWLLIVA